MKTAVRYFSRGGNTEKLAEAIAEAVGVKAEDVSVPITEKVDLLFLGNSVYAGNPDDAVKAFLQQNAGMIGAVASFGSSASLRSNRKKLAAMGGELSFRLCEEEFICPGSFLFLHKGRPNADDCAAAQAFARKLVE